MNRENNLSSSTYVYENATEDISTTNVRALSSNLLAWLQLEYTYILYHTFHPL